MSNVMFISKKSFLELPYSVWYMIKLHSYTSKKNTLPLVEWKTIVVSREDLCDGKKKKALPQHPSVETIKSGMIIRG